MPAMRGFGKRPAQRNRHLELLCAAVITLALLYFTTTHSRQHNDDEDQHHGTDDERPHHHSTARGDDSSSSSSSSSASQFPLTLPKVLLPRPNGDYRVFIDRIPEAGLFRVFNPFARNGGFSSLSWFLCGMDDPSQHLVDTFVAQEYEAALVEDYAVELLDAFSARTKRNFTAQEGGGGGEESSYPFAMYSIPSNAKNCQIRVRLADEARRAQWTSEMEASTMEPDRRLQEGYALHVLDKLVNQEYPVEITVTHVHGLLNALRTLLEHASQSPNPFWGTLRSTLILRNDIPRHAYRGQHLDTARHYFNVSTIKKLLRTMSRAKLNRFHWHFCDDQGWRLESDVYPALHELGSRRGAALNGALFQKYNGVAYRTPHFHSKRDIAVLIEFARKRAIEIVPELDLPAHATAIVLALPQFGSSMNPHAVNGDCRDAWKPTEGAPNCMQGTFGIMHPTVAALTIAKQLLAEVCRLFPTSTMMHLGGDEADFVRTNLWKRVPHDIPGVPRNASHAQIQVTLTSMLAEWVGSEGSPCARTSVVWDDTIELTSKAVPPPPNTVTMIWRDDYMTVAKLRAKYEDTGRDLSSLRVVLAPKTRFYFDYLQHPVAKDNRVWPIKLVPSSVTEKAVTLKRSFMSFSMFHADETAKEHVIGVTGCLWTEFLSSEFQLGYQLLPRLLALSEVAWGETGADPKSSLEERFGEFAKRAREHEGVGRSFFDA